MSFTNNTKHGVAANCHAPQLRLRAHEHHRPFQSVARRDHRVAINARAAKTEANKSATAAIERGLEAFSQGNSKEALTLFQEGLSLNPNKDEARAALYNSACCLVKDKQWQGAADAITRACNDYGLKYAVALKVVVAPCWPNLSRSGRQAWCITLSCMSASRIQT